MFNNLIESKSHARDFKRRGSFLLITTVAYGLLFSAIGVVSIYAYDAHLEKQSEDLEVISFVPPEPNQVNQVRPTPTHNAATARGDAGVSRPERTQFIDRPDNPMNVPKGVSAVAQSIPPFRPDAVITGRNLDPLSSGKPAGTGPGDRDGSAIVQTIDIPPPARPAPTPKPVLRIITKGVISGEAVDLPKPQYPPMAKAIHLQGSVNVQVLIDESGRVVSAHAVTGNPLLVTAAEQAAHRARFSPTKLGDQPVKVSGIIIYNFVIN